VLEEPPQGAADGFIVVHHEEGHRGVLELHARSSTGMSGRPGTATTFGSGG
jgi:hypothetical protein